MLAALLGYDSLKEVAQAVAISAQLRNRNFAALALLQNVIDKRQLSQGVFRGGSVLLCPHLRRRSIDRGIIRHQSTPFLGVTQPERDYIGGGSLDVNIAVDEVADHAGINHEWRRIGRYKERLLRRGLTEGYENRVSETGKDHANALWIIGGDDLIVPSQGRRLRRPANLTNDIHLRPRK